MKFPVPKALFDFVIKLVHFRFYFGQSKTSQLIQKYGLSADLFWSEEKLWKLQNMSPPWGLQVGATIFWFLGWVGIWWTSSIVNGLFLLQYKTHARKSSCVYMPVSQISENWCSLWICLLIHGKEIYRNYEQADSLSHQLCTSSLDSFEIKNSMGGCHV